MLDKNTGRGTGEMRVHDSRDSAGSEMINDGGELTLVGDVLGHKSAVSAQRCNHPRTATLTEAVKWMVKESRTCPESP